MPKVGEICDWLERFAPSALAEEWDNVGLLVGRRSASVERLMTCLTVTPESVGEATARGAQLIVTHHPLPFRPLKRITDDSTPGRLLLELIAAGVAVYSPHTSFDSAAAGINQQLAERLGGVDVAPLISKPTFEPGSGSGRKARLPNGVLLRSFAEQVKRRFDLSHVKYVGDPEQTVQTFATGCGSGGEFLSAAKRAGAEALVTGEATFHVCLEAQATSIGLVLMGHYASERFAVERLAQLLAESFPDAECWPSQEEKDPLRWL